MKSVSKIKTLTFACSLFVVVSFTCGDIHAKTLSEAVLASWANHPAREAAIANNKFTKREVQEEESDYLPEITASATTGRQYANNSTTRGLSVTRGAGYSYFWDANIALTQPLYRAGELGASLSSAKAREKASLQSIYDAEEFLASSAAASYIELLRVYRAMAVVAQQKAVMDDYIARIEKAVNDGASDENELKQAVSSRLFVDAAFVDLEGQLNAAQAGYIEAVGEPPLGQMTTPILPPGVLPRTVQEAIDVARVNQASIKRASFEAEAAKHEIDSASAELYPTIDAELSALKSEKRDLIGGEAEDVKMMLRMNWSFETGFGGLHRINKTRYQHEESLARVREQEKRIDTTVRLAFGEYEAAMKQLVTQKKRLALTQDLFSTVQNQFEGARSSLLELSQAHNQKFQVTLEEINAQHRMLNAQYGVLSATGQLSNIVETADLAELR